MFKTSTRRAMAMMLAVLMLFFNLGQPIWGASENKNRGEEVVEDTKDEERANKNDENDQFDWRKEGMDNGIYPIDTLNYIGKNYMGESIRAILAMSEDEELPDWNIKEFFKDSIFRGLNLDDLRRMLDEEVTLRDYALSYVMPMPMSMLSTTGTLIMNNTPYDDDFKISYTDRKGNNRTLVHNGRIFNNDMRVGGDYLPVFCAQMGKAASTGLVYREYSDPSDIGLGNPAVLAIKRAAYWYDQKNSDLTFVAAQVYVWAVINGAETDDTSILEATFKQLGLANDKIQTRVNFFEKNVIPTVTSASYSGVTLRYWMSPNESQQNFVSFKLDIQNEYGRIAVRKRSTGTSETLQGVRFRIYEDSECSDYVTNIITGDDGNGQSIKIPTGTYYVQENANYVPKGYIPDDKVYKVTVTKDSTSYVSNNSSNNNFYNDPWEGYLRINKRNSTNTGELLSGATFQLQEYDKDLGDYKAVGQLSENGGVYSTGKMTYTQSNLGWFQAVELSAPTGFVNSGAVVKFNISADKKITLNSNNVEYTASDTNPATADVNNKPFEAYVNAVKKDSVTGERLAGATFGLYEYNAASGGYNHVRNLAGDANGNHPTGVLYYTTSNLGRYRISEVQAPTGYKKAGGDLDFAITGDGQVTVDGANHTATMSQPYERDFLNVPIWVRIRVDKVDVETGKRLSGTTFRVYRYNKNSGDYEFNTSYNPATTSFSEQADGTYLSDPIYYNNLNEGKFCVEETVARRGYFGDFTGHDGYNATGSLIRYYFTMRAEHDERTLNLSKSGIDTDGSFPNEPTKGELIVSKIDREAEAYVGRHGDATLEGAVYGLYADEAVTHPDGRTGALYQKDDLVMSGTIRNGGFTLKNIRLGNYYLKEITPPEGYVLDETKYPIAFTYENQTQRVILKRETVMEQVKKQPFELIKISEDGEQTEVDLVEGAGFSIFLISDVERLLAEKGVEAPFKRNSSREYDLQEMIKFFSELNQYGISVSDIPTATLYKKSSDAWTQGDRSWLEKVSGNQYRVKEMFTDYKGYILSPELPYGEYVVVETTQVDELALVDPFLVSVRDDSRTSQTWRIFDDRPFTAYLRIIKKDADTGQTVLKPGTTYQIFRVKVNEGGKETETLIRQTVSDGNRYVTHETFTTDGEGVVQTYKPLKVGSYRIRETEAPNGYFNAGGYIEVKISSHTAYQTEVVGDDSFVVIVTDYENGETKGLLQIQKSGEVLTGLKSGKGFLEKVVEFVKGLFGGESEGEYDFIYEERPLAGASYEVYADGDVYTQDAQLDKNGNRMVWFGDGELVARITTGKDGRIESLNYSALEGKPHSHMVRLRLDGGANLDDCESQDAGVLGLELPLGNYRVVEAKAPFGYVIDETKYPVSFTWEDQYKEVVLNKDQKTGTEDGYMYFKDERAKAEIGVEKKDSDAGEPLAGVTFGLYPKDDVYNADGKLIAKAGQLLATATTGEDGRATFDVDPPHRSQDHVPNDEELDDVESEKEDDLLEDADGDEDTDDETDDGEDAEGEGEPDGGEAEPEEEEAKNPTNSGRYYVKELKAADGYYPDDEPKGILLEYGGQDKELTKLTLEWRNDPTKITVSKTGLLVDGGEAALPGATLQIVDPDSDEAVREWVTGESPMEVKTLAFDKEYLLREKHPAPGYATAADVRFKLLNASIPYDEAEEGEARQSLKILVKNTEGGWVENPDDSIKMVDDFTKTVIYKTDAETSNPVKGATLELRDAAGTVLASWESDGGKAFRNLMEAREELKTAPVPNLEVRDGAYVLTGLPIGTYTLHEAEAPFSEGYVTAKDVEVVVADTGEVQEYTMVDDYTKVKIHKKDMVTDKGLKGATLRLYHDGEIVEEWVSGKKPQYFERLPVGEYVLHEEEAPEGYELANDVTITVADDAAVQEFEMLDAPDDGDEDDGKPRPPKTGDPTQWALYLALALTGAAGMGATLYKMRKRKR